MLRINRLSKELASQIAAGEVIERPVSVVKELLENAVDAQASQIEIAICDAGFTSIQVADNGMGIDKNDLILALEPHCTSKLQSIEDLYAITSKGFRGEALASMASVAKIELCSRPSHQECAMRIEHAHGVRNLSSAIRDVGTTIEVKDLFYNVPVRKKFLKSPGYEWSAIEALVKRFTLSCPSIHFVLRHNQELILDLPAALSQVEHYARIKKLWGKSFEDAIAIDIERSGLKINGWLGNLQNHRSQNDRLWIFLNQRIVQDKLILHALKQVYLPLLPPGRHPQCVLYLEIPPTMVDINVHPAKQEVRFEQPRLIYDFILSSLKSFWQVPVENVPPEPTSHNSMELPAVVSHNYTICNAEYIIASLAPFHYLVNVAVWWQEHMQYNASGIDYGASRTLLMPYIAQVPKLNEKLLLALMDNMQKFGIEMQIWSENSICIRSIPAWLPQFNLKNFVNLVIKALKVDDISRADLVKCCQFTAYDLSSIEYDLIQTALANNQNGVFAKQLSIENCRKIFNEH